MQPMIQQAAKTRLSFFELQNALNEASVSKETIEGQL
jgi:hypothetical protein